MSDTPRFSTRDIIAGISVALILIPQSLAYAEIAGVPAYIGLYAAALPPLAAAFFASSRYLQTGPVAMTALLTFGALSPIVVPETKEYVLAAALLALVVGVARIVMGLLHGGMVAYFLSQPILIGFTAAASLLILGSQLPTALGVTAPDGGIVYRALWAAVHPGEWQAAAIVLSIVTIVLVLGGRRISALFPGVMLAVAFGIGYSIVAGYPGAIVGDIPAGLPPFSIDLPWGDIGSLIVPGIVIALVGFAEPASIARMFAAQDRERWDPDRELISQGVANIASGFSGGFPVGGSFSRTSVNKLAGGSTRWAGAVTGLVVLAFLPIAGILSDLPRAILAAIVIAAVARLIRVDQVMKLLPVSRPQWFVATTTFVATLGFAPRIERGVLLGVALGALVHVMRERRIEIGHNFVDGELTLRPAGVLFYLSAPAIDERLLHELAENPDATVLILDLSRLGRVDYTGALTLKTVIDEAEAAGLEVRVIGVPETSRSMISKVLDL